MINSTSTTCLMVFFLAQKTADGIVNHREFQEIAFQYQENQDDRVALTKMSSRDSMSVLCEGLERRKVALQRYFAWNVDGLQGRELDGHMLQS